MEGARGNGEAKLTTLWGRPAAKSELGKEAMTVAEWAPLVDITEDDKEYVIKADLPDVKKDDVKISVQDNVVAISGERKYEKEEKGKKYHRMERAYGSFLRSFMLPEDADGANIAAEIRMASCRCICPSPRRPSRRLLK